MTLWEKIMRFLGRHPEPGQRNGVAELEAMVAGARDRQRRAAHNLNQAVLDDIERTTATRAAIDDLMRQMERRAQ